MNSSNNDTQNVQTPIKLINIYLTLTFNYAKHQLFQLCNFTFAQFS